MVGAIVVIILALAAIFAPYIVPVNPHEMDFDNILSPPSSKHLMGTDHFGRYLPHHAGKM